MHRMIRSIAVLLAMMLLTPARFAAAQAPAPEPAPMPAEPAPEIPPAEAPPAETTVEDMAPVGPEDIGAGPEVAPAPRGIEEITVTGSGIRRKDLITPAPVSILNKADLDAAGKASIGEVLQNLVTQSNAINVQVNNGGDGSTRVNLRGLGTARTLVLLNGRRHVYGGNGADASVDLNAVPFAVIERVEVLKDGGSAIYGSDAVAGVVNVITRRGFNGLEGTAFTATSQRGGGTIYDLAVTGGSKSAKGNILVSAGYYRQSEIMAGQRDYAAFDRVYDYETGEVAETGSSGIPETRITINRMAEGATQGNEMWQQVLANSTSANLVKDRMTGQWRDFNPNGTSDIGTGDFYNYQPANYLVTPAERYNVFSNGDYELRSGLKIFFEASYLNRQSDQLLAAEPFFQDTEGLVVSANNVYNPFGRDFGGTTSTGFLRRRMEETGGRKFLQDVTTSRFVGGVEAEIPNDAPVLKGWTWDLSYNYGRTAGTETKQGLFQRSKFQNAVGPSFIDPADGLAYCGAPDAPISRDVCVPLNLFGGAGSLNDEEGQLALRRLGYTGVLRGYNQQMIVGLNGTGTLFEIPFGGPVGLAVGAQFRDEAGAQIPDPLTAQGDTTGNKTEPVEGDYQVVEGFAELAAMLVQSKPGAEAVEVSAAIRAFDYSTFGSDFTWKVGARWQIIRDVAIRGTMSTAFRAPSINDLYSGVADDFPNVTDPCDTSGGARSPTADANCAADGLPATFMDDRTQLRARIGGNPNLEPETAEIFTVGTVLVPRFLEGFSLTLDYFNITVDNSIQQAGAEVLLNNCYQNVNRSDCDKIQRDADGSIQTITDTTTNIGGADTAGLDISAGYRLKAGAAGNFRLGVDLTWLQKYDEIQASGRVVKGKGNYDLGVRPEWRASASVLWNLAGFGAGVNARYIGGFLECPDFNCNASLDDPSMEVPSRDVSANMTADLFGSYDVTSPIGKTTLTVGVNNVLDQDPSVIYDGFWGDSDATGYDFLGRFFYLRLTQAY
jgi:iron complex outermembrane receptor protein